MTKKIIAVLLSAAFLLCSCERQNNDTNKTQTDSVNLENSGKLYEDANDVLGKDMGTISIPERISVSDNGIYCNYTVNGTELGYYYCGNISVERTSDANTDAEFVKRFDPEADSDEAVEFKSGSKSTVGEISAYAKQLMCI